MAQVLDIVALRSLIAVADHGGFHRAARALLVSQSTVSLHVRRLEKVIGRPAVEPDGRRSRFTPDGLLLLDEARRIVGVHDSALGRLAAEAERVLVVGSTEHAADRILPVLAAAAREVHPGCQVRFRVDRSARLREAVERGAVDLAVLLAGPGRGDGRASGSLPLRWYAAPGWQRPVGGGPLPLVAVEEPCTIRHRALRVLAEHGIAAGVVCDAAYLAGVLDAARAGLGLALLATAGACPDGLVEVPGLPPVPAAPLAALAGRGSDPRLAAAAVRAVRQLLAGPGPVRAGLAPAREPSRSGS
ncbi:LysR substrate-binding domain-containing protein [Kitasatospora sp. NBC_00315]|uniref:LysR substrate-binding domain-containing protein n=1 Tax=Kitasatospora sp. NBC_00315 TaxID=2975963 RepID=UPI00324C7989